jgi:hypothetical protein
VSFESTVIGGLGYQYPLLCRFARVSFLLGRYTLIIDFLPVVREQLKTSIALLASGVFIII